MHIIPLKMASIHATFPPFLTGSMLNYLIVYFMFRSKRTFSTRSSVLDAPNPSPLYSFTWQQSWCFPRDSMSCCPVPTHNHKTGTMHRHSLSLCPVPAHNAPVHFKSEGSAASFLSPCFPPGFPRHESFRVRGVLLRIQFRIFMFRLCFPHFVLFLKLISLISHLNSMRGKSLG